MSNPSFSRPEIVGSSVSTALSQQQRREEESSPENLA
jgi:hypothetical protein